MSKKYALIIGNTEYSDPGLAQLSAPSKDVEDFAVVLRSKEICDFDDVKVFVNEPSSSVITEIDEFFDQKRPDDLLVLYFSGHGIKDENGSLYLGFKNTNRSRLRSSAIKSDYIREAMDQSRSKRQVLILDCCNSGAFPQGTKAELGGAMGLLQAFQGYGRFVLTASDATQFAWEGNKVLGGTDNSLFTHYLIEGLKGEADNDGDGKITVDELYDYAYHQISTVTPKQRPTKSASKQEGEIVLRQNIRIEDIKPVNLPDNLLEEIEDDRPYVREAAVQKLEKILKGKNLGQARSAAVALEKIVNDENTTRRVSQVATQVLDTYNQTLQQANEERLAKLEAESLAYKKPEAKQLAGEKPEAEPLVAPKVGEKNKREANEDHQLTINTKQTKLKASTLFRFGTLGVAIIAICICGYFAIILFPNILGQLSPTETQINASPTKAPATPVPTSLALPTQVITEGAAISNIRVSSDEGGVKITDTFSINDTIYVVCDLTNGVKGSQAVSRWYAENVVGVDPNFFIDEAVIDVTEESFNGTVFFFFDPPTNGWPIGKYKVELYFNGVLNSTVSFSVK